MTENKFQVCHEQKKKKCLTSNRRQVISRWEKTQYEENEEASASFTSIGKDAHPHLQTHLE